MKPRITVLGGGLGSLAAVYGLTSQSDWRDRYESITVYQMGWRLGGKGASGRNSAVADRIEEHGLHVWYGFYDNAFRMMQTCYEEQEALNRREGRAAGPFSHWTHAFEPHSLVVLEELVGGRWKHWPMQVPTNSKTPGGERDMEPWEYARAALEALQDHFASSPYSARADSGQDVRDSPAYADLLDEIARLFPEIRAQIDAALLVTAGRLLEHALAAAQALPLDPGQHSEGAHELIVALLDRFRLWLWESLSADIAADDEARRFWLVLDLGITLIRGALFDRIMFRGFDAIDDTEFSTWLGRHHAREQTVGSPLVRGMYEGTFAYVKGDPRRPNLAAGVGLQLYLRVYLSYKGAFLYKLQAGMGDVVFSPIYRVLRERGVKFEFFHRVDALRVDEEAKTIVQIDLEKQTPLDTSSGRSEYSPLTWVNQVPCWPSMPRFEQLVDGKALEDAFKNNRINFESFWSPSWRNATKVELKKGVDYDIVVLGIPIEALKTIAADVVARDQDWQRMVLDVQTVRTQSLQLWFTRHLGGLGWEIGSPALAGYVGFGRSWLDSSQVAMYENWPLEHAPRCIGYFCMAAPDDPMEPEPPDPSYPASEAGIVLEDAREWLQNHAAHFWPRIFTRGERRALDWNVFVDPSGKNGASRLESQYYRVNINPSERYVLSVAGSTTSRLEAGESGFVDLYLTGDWIRNGFNHGNVESTVIAGLQCSRAISGYPRSIIGEHFFRLAS